MASRQARQSVRQGFTLIELLVVVAIIALLISILLPSLSKARGQARTSVCASRISQLVKAMIIYAEDYGETPAFMGLGWEDIPDFDRNTTNAPYDISRMTCRQWAEHETWLTQRPDLMWNASLLEEEWEQNGIGVKTGTLFPYARFEALYRCPDFEREPAAVQHQFNYTRSILGRKWIMGEWSEGGKEPDYWGSSNFGAPGPIMKLSQIHAPSNLWMFVDEWWKRTCGAPINEHASQRETLASGGWSATDCMFFPLTDEIGRYHGSAVGNTLFPPARLSVLDPLKVQQGSCAFYDGHSKIEREFWADKSEKPEPYLYFVLTELFNWLSMNTFAQRGKVILGGEI